MMSCQSLITASASPVKALRRLMPALLTRIETLPTSPATLRGDRAAGRPVGHVEREGCALPPASRICCGGLGRRLAVDVEHGDLRALARIAERDRAADAGASAGDRRDVVFEKPGHALSSVWIINRYSIANVELRKRALGV